MGKGKTLAEFYEQMETDEINMAIATLERFRMRKENIFVKIEASKLSLIEEFMMYIPRTARQVEFKTSLSIGINKGYKDIWVPILAPSFNASKTNIHYVKGEKPAVGESYKWWKRVAENFWPERKSRLGTEYEYYAFLAILIKKLIGEAGWEPADAWYAVCDDSERLGVYYDDIGPEFGMSNTGSLEICGLCDLALAYKMLDSEDLMQGFFYGGGCCETSGFTYPLASVKKCACMGCLLEATTGWVILEADEE